MKEYTIDCTGLDTPRQLHEAISQEMGFPEWYGKNLDALHDMLTAIHEDTTLTLLHFDALPPFRGGFRIVLNEAEEENPFFFVSVL